ncbi:MAG: enoyl-CoA hydratase/isomerase family protein [Pseudomonadota bacterium]
MTLHYTKENHIARFVLDNPPVNVFTPAMHKEFFGILQDFIADDDMHVGVWTAAGTRAFCAGDDIKTPRPERSPAEMVRREMAVRHDGESLEYPGWEVEIQGLTRFKPIVSAVNGYCLGQGFIYMMLLSDIRIASTNAQFGLPEIKYGMGGAGGVIRLARMIPHTSAMWMLLTGEMFGPEEALRHHVVNEVVEPDALQERAMEVAGLIASHPPLAVRTEMEAYQRAGEMSRQDALAFASRLYRLQRLAMDPAPPLADRGES